MKRLDHTSIDPDVEAALEAIDATLAGEPVDPAHAELAELALLVAAQRPQAPPAFIRALDERVARRFAAVPDAGVAARPARRWSWLSLGALASVSVAALVAVVVVAGLHSPSSSSVSTASSSGSGGVAGASTSAASARPHRTSDAASRAAPLGGHAAGAPSTRAFSARGGSAHGARGSLDAASALTPKLPSTGRKAIQSAEIELAASPNAIDSVAQEVFDTVGTVNGIVDRSSVTETGGSDGSASFALRVPSAELAQTLNRLSQLRGAHVVSRTDNSQDVNGQYSSATRALAQAQALRTALLKQLSNAVTTAQIDSLQAQINDANAKIASDQAALSSLNAQINYSRITVMIEARSTPAPTSHGSGFLGRSTHLAGRVIVVAAGVALVGLAALVPVGLVAALLAWIAAAVRRRRREHALDMA